MSPKTIPLRPFPSPAGPTSRRRRPHSQATRLGSDVLVAMSLLPPTPAADEVAEVLRWTAEELAPVLAALERGGLIERWADADRAGLARVMFSRLALARLGLALTPKGDRWNPDFRNPRPTNDRLGPSQY